MGNNPDEPKGCFGGCFIFCVGFVLLAVKLGVNNYVAFVIAGTLAFVYVVFKSAYGGEKQEQNPNITRDSEGREWITIGTIASESSSAVQNASNSARDDSDKSFTTLCNETLMGLESFQYHLEHDEQFQDQVNNHLNGLEKIDQSFSVHHRHNKRLSFLIMEDLIKCYESMGYSVKTSGKERLPLMMYLAALVCSPDDYNLSGSKAFPQKAKQNVVNILSSLSGILSSDDMRPDDMFLGMVLRNFAPDLYKEYMGHLHRFSLLVAKADGYISPKEQKFISGLIPGGGTDLVKSSGGKSYKKSSPEDSEEKLNSLIGLESVKEEVRRLRNFITIDNKRREQGLKTTPISYHCVFTGNPGTGKTTVARIIADIYRELGVVKQGQLVETDRSGLVAEYVGQTAVKTNRIIDTAIDGVLFVDEAYSLANGDSKDFGYEAIATLLKRMEDDRDRLVVILAGYGDEMRRFIDSNPGLQSRFSRYIHFPDYSASDLLAIVKRNLTSNDFIITPEAEQRLKAKVENIVATKDHNFGNARTVRNLFERILEHQAERLVSLKEVCRDDLQTILPDDIPN